MIKCTDSQLAVWLCREHVWTFILRELFITWEFWSPATALQEEVANRCMQLIRKRIGGERYI